MYAISLHSLPQSLLAALVGMVAGVLVCRMAERGAQDALAAPSTRRAATCAALGAATYAALGAAYGPCAETVELWAFAAILLRLSLTDLDRFVIPNAGIMAAVGVRVAYLCLQLLQGTLAWATAAYYLASALGVGLALLATVLVADRLLSMESMGGGDLKLFAVAALYVGWQQCIPLVVLSCLLGLAFAFVVRRDTAFGTTGPATGSAVFPFGPSIALAAIVTLLWGDSAVAWYLNLLA